MNRLVLIIRVHEGDLRMNSSSADRSRGPKGWSTIQDSVLGDFIDMNKHHRSTGWREVLKYLKRKLLPPH